MAGLTLVANTPNIFLYQILVSNSKTSFSWPVFPRIPLRMPTFSSHLRLLRLFLLLISRSLPLAATEHLFQNPHDENPHHFLQIANELSQYSYNCTVVQYCTISLSSSNFSHEISTNSTIFINITISDECEKSYPEVDSCFRGKVKNICTYGAIHSPSISSVWPRIWGDTYGRCFFMDWCP